MTSILGQNNPSGGVLGLIAGQGRLPFLVAHGARSAGLRVVCVGFAGQADETLADHVDEFCCVPIARPGKWIRHLRRWGATRTIMVGRVAKKRIYTPWRLLEYRPDWRAIRLWYGRLRGRDKRNDTLLAALADELATGGIILENSVQYCREHLAIEGVMTRKSPSESVIADIEFGWRIVKQMGQLDIGQAIAVKEREVIAVEAIEGTDRMIARAGELCKSGGWTLIKVAKPNQDMRFDVPTVGTATIENLKRNGAVCVAVEAGKTLLIDRNETITVANKSGITIVGRNN